MCGRFSFAVKARIIEERFDVEVDFTLLTPRYNCAPSQKLAVISNANPGTLSFYRWGLIPSWAKDSKIGNKMINAKSETITEKPSFRQAFKTRRCLVPADSFYEWKKDAAKDPYRIMMADESPFAMAGIWETWKNETGEEIRSFSILTTDSNPLVAGIHTRMPLILTRENEKKWLTETREDSLKAMLLPYVEAPMKAVRISHLVNTPLNDRPEIWQTL